MENILLIVGIGILLSIIYLIYSLKGNKGDKTEKLIFEYFDSLRREMRETSTESRKETQVKLELINDRLAKGLQQSSNTIQKQFSDSAKMIKDITEELSKVKETNKQVLGFSEQLQSLENILKNPKQRGILGEYFLETMLGHVLQPNQYQMQYSFENGEVVDAVVFFQDKIVPIDAKFSLEKYNLIMEEKDSNQREKLEKEFKNDIKIRIDETSKYIRPSENTTDFAIMFIPAEGIYYNLLIYKVGSLNVNTNDLIEYAFKKRVMIVSPTSFFAYLQTVLQGLKALKMEQSIYEIVKKVGELGRHLEGYETYLQKMGNNLGTTVNMYNSAYKEFKKIDKDVYKITLTEAGGKVEPVLLDRPQIDNS